MTTQPCPHCGGTGVVVLKFAAVVVMLADTFGVEHVFLAAEAVHLLGDDLEARLRHPKRLGKALAKIAGQNFDGLTVKRIDKKDRGAVVWVIARV